MAGERHERAVACVNEPLLSFLQVWRANQTTMFGVSGFRDMNGEKTEGTMLGEDDGAFES
jgi:hypothetical protein